MDKADDTFLQSPENPSGRGRPRSRLAQFRILSGLRQSDLAREIGLSTAWVSSLEHGTIIPSLQQMIRIAKVFGVPVESLFPEDSGIEETDRG